MDFILNRKFPLFVRDGGKFKPTRILICIVSGMAILAIFGLQLVSTFELGSRSTPANVEPPKLEQVSSVKPPEVTSTVTANKIEHDRKEASRQHAMTFQPIKTINLSGKTGIPDGSEIPATLSSGGSNGTVTAHLSSSLQVNGDTILPQGTLLFGKGSSSEDRLYIVFSKAVLPDKTKIKVKAQAFDEKDRMAGLKGKKISDYVFKIAASSGLIFLSGLAEGMKEDTNSNPFTQRRPTVKDAALNGVSTAAIENGREMLQKMNEEKSRVEVKAATKIVVIFGDDENE